MLWSGDHVFEGTVETLEMLRSKGTYLLHGDGANRLAKGA